MLAVHGMATAAWRLLSIGRFPCSGQRWDRVPVVVLCEAEPAPKTEAQADGDATVHTPPARSLGLILSLSLARSLANLPLLAG